MKYYIFTYLFIYIYITKNLNDTEQARTNPIWLVHKILTV